MHLSTYQGEERIEDEDRVGARGVGALNAPVDEVQELKRIEQGGLTTNEAAEQSGENLKKKEEAGGKKETAPPTALDKGAREYGGEAGGTHTSPGPSAALVQAAVQAEQGKMNGARVDGAVDLPNDMMPGQKAHWSVAEVMNPHLQLMYVYDARLVADILRCGPLLSYFTVQEGVWYGAAMVVTADEYVLSRYFR